MFGGEDLAFFLTKVGQGTGNREEKTGNRMTLAGVRAFPGFAGETLDTEGGGGFNSRKPPSTGFWKSIHAAKPRSNPCP
jgi:hypothetical protein